MGGGEESKIEEKVFTDRYEKVKNGKKEVLTDSMNGPPAARERWCKKAISHLIMNGNVICCYSFGLGGHH